LFVRGIGLWVILMAAAVAFAVAVSQIVDPDAMTRATRGAQDDATAHEAGKIVLLSLGMVLFAGIAYPLLQAIVMRWWLEGLRMGPLAVTTTLRKRSIIGAYLRCFLYAAPLVIVALIAIPTVADDVDAMVMTGAGVVTYLVVVLGVWVLHQTTVRLR